MDVPVVYSARYGMDIGPHVFPTRKYRLVYERLLEIGTVLGPDVVDPLPAAWEELGRVHGADYLSRMRLGELTAEDVAQLELPWSAEMVDGFRTMVGGTIAAATLAVFDAPRRRAVHIGGGLHHAFPNHGEGFCPFNDVAVAIEILKTKGMKRAAVIDLDVHHGNGTAFIFNGRSPSDEVFTFSMHQQHNYPMWKPASSLDIGLADGVHDETYLEKLRGALPQVMASRPQCVFYLAGADPYEDDQLGGLGLTRAGLATRDRMVIDAVTAAAVPLVVVLAGGYARRVEDTVAIHVATIEMAVS